MRHCIKLTVTCLLLLCLAMGAGAQQQQSLTDTVVHAQKINKRLPVVIITGSVLYGSSLAVLNKYWYAGHDKSSFHFFDDGPEWLQMDKAGHMFASYYEGLYGMKMLQWAGLSHKKAVWYGGTWGLLLQTPIEILDGYSSAWGFSWGDFGANTLGTAMFVAQELAWQEQKVQLKFSYTPSPYARLNPNLLGSNLPERLIKDYNGQTYWLSTSFNTLGLKAAPPWLNIALGYGADKMLRGTPADQQMDPLYNTYNRQRQYYLSLDLNLQKIKTNRKLLKSLFQVVAFIKVPAPALEYSTNDKFRFRFLYF